MEILIAFILILAYILIATEYMTNVNKAAVAIFAAATGWVLYVCYGTDFVSSQHGAEFAVFKANNPNLDDQVKYFISSKNVFLPYVGRAAEISLFLLATMNIVSILNANGCFDFIRPLLRTRSSQRMLWTLAVVTFFISANLDNLTTVVMMLAIMNSIVPNRRLRMIYGSVILLSANVGGVLTVIGNPEGLVLWNTGAVTATDYSLTLAVPCLVAWIVPLILIGKMLPERIETEFVVMPYRGDDTRLNVWQRLLMLIVGIGGLWFIPTFHNITKLSPFLGALCVLAVLWIVNEVFNRKLIASQGLQGMMPEKGLPQVLQYGTVQMVFYVLGLMLAVGLAQETGTVDKLTRLLNIDSQNMWLVAFVSGMVSVVLDNFATAVTFFSFHSDDIMGMLGNDYSAGGMYWKTVAFAIMAGGNIMATASISGLAMMKIEKIHAGWFFRNIGIKAMIGGVAGFFVMYILNSFI